MTGRGVPQPSVDSLKPRFPGSPPHPAVSIKASPRPASSLGDEASPGKTRCAHCGASATVKRLAHLIGTGRDSDLLRG